MTGLSTPWHTRQSTEVEQELGTSLETGLDITGMETDGPERMVVPVEDAGKQIVEAITHDKRRTLIGYDATTMWWANRVSPDLASNLIYQGMKDLLQ